MRVVIGNGSLGIVSRRQVQIPLDRYIYNFTAYTPAKIIHLNGNLDYRKQSMLLKAKSGHSYIYNGIDQLPDGSWCIVIDNNKIGNYSTSKEAALAYDDFVISRDGLYAKTNFYKEAE